MPFDLENLNPPQRFWWNDEEWVELHQPSPTDLKKIFGDLGCKWKVERVLNNHTRRMERIEYLDVPKDKNDVYEETLIDLKIVNWNFKTPVGDDIPCTKANKVMLVRGVPSFAAWIDEKLTEAEQADITAHEEEIKN